jgi:hypothetical protein
MFANAGGELVNRQWRQCETWLLGVNRDAVNGDLSD